MRQERQAFFAAFLLLVVFAPQAMGGTLPSFSLDECAWDATHIVVVTEGKKIDSIVEVLESWKGDRKRGETLTFDSNSGDKQFRSNSAKPRSNSGDTIFNS